MNHVRLLAHISWSDVFEVETLRVVEVELNGRALPATADRILDVHIDLGPVEGSFPGGHSIRNPGILERLTQVFLADFPPALLLDVLLVGLSAQVGLEVGESKVLQPLHDEIEVEAQL